MLPCLGARQDAKAAFPESPKSSPIVPRQFCPSGPALIPMQDDSVVGVAGMVVSGPHPWPQIPYYRWSDGFLRAS